mmetsp:Transcript_5968/g.14503  ORF Transcript_5968/g.14503 Transcript_5968/m.14503 type:complete len:81 (+) Transcript_5968:574-816(+)
MALLARGYPFLGPRPELDGVVKFRQRAENRSHRLKDNKRRAFVWRAVRTIKGVGKPLGKIAFPPELERENDSFQFFTGED